VPPAAPWILESLHSSYCVTLTDAMTAPGGASDTFGVSWPEVVTDTTLLSALGGLVFRRKGIRVDDRESLTFHHKGRLFWTCPKRCLKSFPVRTPRSILLTSIEAVLFPCPGIAYSLIFPLFGGIPFLALSCPRPSPPSTWYPVLQAVLPSSLQPDYLSRTTLRAPFVITACFPTITM